MTARYDPSDVPDEALQQIDKERSELTYDERRFWTKTAAATDSDCIEWDAGPETGYGGFHSDGKSVAAHRWVFDRYMQGDLSDHEVIRHLCHNKRCVNIKHIKGGTQQENVQDMLDAGRDNYKTEAWKRYVDD